MIPLFNTGKRFVRYLLTEVVLRGVFISASKPVVMCTVQVQPLLPADLRTDGQVSQAHLCVCLVPTAFLHDAPLMNVMVDRPVPPTVHVVIDGPVEHPPILQEHAHRHHGLDHGRVPVPICGRVKVLDDRVEDLAKHSSERTLIRIGPPVVRMFHQLRRVHVIDAGHSHQQSRIVLGDGPERVGPGVEHLHGLPGMLPVLSDVPLYGVCLSGLPIHHEFRRTDVRVVVRPPLHVSARIGRPIQPCHPVIAKFLPSGYPGFRFRPDLFPDRVEFSLIVQHTRVNKCVILRQTHSLRFGPPPGTQHESNGQHRTYERLLHGKFLKHVTHLPQIQFAIRMCEHDLPSTSPSSHPCFREQLLVRLFLRLILPATENPFDRPTDLFYRGARCTSHLTQHIPRSVRHVANKFNGNAPEVLQSP